MDPFTIIGAVTAIADLVYLSKDLCQSLISMRESFLSAEDALKSMQGDVQALSSSLEQLKDAIENGETKGVEYPFQTKADLQLVIQNCKSPLSRLRLVLAKFSQFGDLAGAAKMVIRVTAIKLKFRWMMEEKNLLTIQDSLQVHKNSLAIILGLMSNLREIKIEKNTSDIKTMMEALRQEIHNRSILTSKSVKGLPSLEDQQSLDTAAAFPPKATGTGGDNKVSSAPSNLPQLGTRASGDPASISTPEAVRFTTPTLVTLSTTSDSSLPSAIPEQDPPSEPDTTNPPIIGSQPQRDPDTMEEDHGPKDPAKVGETPPSANSPGKTSQGSGLKPHKTKRCRSPRPNYNPSRPLLVPGEIIFDAVESGDKDIIIKVLQSGARITERKADGTTVLQTAVACNREDVVLTLLFFGADASAGGGYDRCPLLTALDRKFLNLVPILLEAGADTNVPGVLRQAASMGSIPLLKLLFAKHPKSESLRGVLNSAVLSGNIEVTKFLLTTPGVDINFFVEKGPYQQEGTPLQVASAKNSLEMVDLLLEWKADPNIISTEYHVMPCDRSPLHAAVWNQNLELMNSLLTSNADPNLAYVKNLPPGVLHLAISRTGNLDIVARLLDAGVDAAVFFDGMTPLVAACNSGHLPIVRHLLQERNANPGFVNPEFHTMPYNRSAAHAAIHSKRPDVLSLFLSSLPDPNVCHNPELPPGLLHYAITDGGGLPTLKALISARVDVNMFFGEDGTALQWAINKGDFEIAKYLLREARADPNIISRSAYSMDYDRSPLHAAVGQKSLEMLDALLDQGADPKLPSGLLHFAATMGDSRIMERLLDTDVDIDAIFATVGPHHGSALNFAAAEGRKEMVEVLLQEGADPSVKSEMYGTALQAAIKNKRSDCVTVLLEYVGSEDDEE